MKAHLALTGFLLKEWLAIASVLVLMLTGIYAQHIPAYSAQEIEVLFIFFVLFVVVNGLQQSGLISALSKNLEKGRFIPLKLITTTFFLSMILTNDVSLIAIVPLTLSLNISRKDILIILEALAANAGSALTPVGNPQNLYIYWFYDVSSGVFVKTIAPFSLAFIAILIIVALLIRVKHVPPASLQNRVNRKAYLHGLLFVVTLLAVFHILPVLTGTVVVFFALIFDRKSLRVDYPLLLTFLLFFGIADNLKIILSTELHHSGHIFLLTALASQIMSNVPATLLFAKFTSNWQALLWGANAGGFGSLFGSLANLIAYRAYTTYQGNKNTSKFTVKFLAIGYGALLVSMAMYVLLYHPYALL